MANFNELISCWDTSNVVNMQGVFTSALGFDQPLARWDVSKVENMEGMFTAAMLFNKPLAIWVVSKVKTMESMFRDAQSFNQPIVTWNVSHVENMLGTFMGAAFFNQPLADWDLSSVKVIGNAFQSAFSFNQDLCPWYAKINVTVTTVYMEQFFSGTKCPNKNDPNWFIKQSFCSNCPTKKPTKSPTTHAPTKKPTKSPTTHAPTKKPTKRPTTPPTKKPTKRPTTRAPTKRLLFGIADSYVIACGGRVTINSNATLYGNIVTSSTFSTGDSSRVFGALDSFRLATLGANANFTGTIISQNATAVGANNQVSFGRFTGDILSKGVVTVGTRGKVVGNIYACSALTLSLGGSVTGQVLKGTAGLPVPSSNHTNVLADVGNAYSYFVQLAGAKDLELSIINNTLLPGIYLRATSWTFAVNRTLTFIGEPSDTWIINLQSSATINGNMNNVGALASNIHWSVKGPVSIGAGSNCCGNIVSASNINVGTGAYLHGSMYSKTGSCTLGTNASLTKL